MTNLEKQVMRAIEIARELRRSETVGNLKYSIYIDEKETKNEIVLFDMQDKTWCIKLHNIERMSVIVEAFVNYVKTH